MKYIFDYNGQVLECHYYIDFGLKGDEIDYNNKIIVITNMMYKDVDVMPLLEEFLPLINEVFAMIELEIDDYENEKSINNKCW